jgi:methionyl-tRNA synthetase
MNPAALLIVSPPPTPNGGLHVGHLSGPYLAADIFKRLAQLHGARAHFAISTDDNQSYVQTTAERLGCDCDTLVQRARSEIQKAVTGYSIALDHFGAQDADYEPFVLGFFRRAREAELLKIEETCVLYDPRTGTYPVESFVQGTCAHCLEETCGGICEACGHPNDGTDLLRKQDAGLVVRREPRLTLDLQSFQPHLEQQVRSAVPLRPALRTFVDAVFSRPLRTFPLSYLTGRGIGLASLGLPGQQLNVWGEMFPGHYYFLQKSRGALRAEDAYVQFLGFDNSFFYVFVHTALWLVAQRLGYEWPRPQAFITNQFYNLQFDKFSTSRGHAVWANDFSRKLNTDVIRLFLALHGPEYQEAEFFPELCQERATALVSEINAIVRRINDGTLQTATRASVPLPDYLRAPPADPHTFSTRSYARRALAAIRFIQRELASPDSDLAPWAPLLLALWLEPLCPRYAAQLRAASNLGAISWRQLPDAPPRAAPALPELPLDPAA